MPQKNKKEYNAYMREYMKQRYYKRRDSVINQLGGKCSICDSTVGLELDHVDRENKKYSISKILAGHSEEKLQKELLKCQVLCSYCHMQKSKKERFGKPETKHGSEWMYTKYKCRCSLCVDSIRSIWRDRHKRARSSDGSSNRLLSDGSSVQI